MTRNIIERGFIKYEGLIEAERTGRRRLHRPAKESLQERMNVKLTEKLNWYKTSKKEKQEEWQTPPKARHSSRISSKNHYRNGQKHHGMKDPQEPAAIMFVKRTPGGNLFNTLRQVEKDLNKTTGHTLKLV